jgi:hypothetical protein
MADGEIINTVFRKQETSASVKGKDFVRSKEVMTRSIVLMFSILNDIDRLPK